MIKHIVLFKLKDFAEGASKTENARLAKAKLEALRCVIPGLVELEVATEFEACDADCDIALYTVFESREALAGYQVHPDHRAVAEFMGRIRESRTVVDYDVDRAVAGDPAASGTGASRWTGSRLLAFARGFQEPRILLSGVELDLFTRLAPAPLTASEVSVQHGANVEALTILLDALAAMGLLVKKAGAYQTEPSAVKWLASDSPESVLPMILHSSSLWERWSALTKVVAGPQADKARGDKWLNAFIGGMHVIATPLAARIVALVDPGTSRRVLDVGGAMGTYTLAFLAASQHLRATLFDRPPVVEMARKVLDVAGVLERVTLVPGDFYVDPLPTGHDLVFVSAIIHQNSPAENAKLFRKAFEALDPGGRIVVRDHVLSPDRTQPKSGALFAINMLVAQNGGNSYTFAEIAAALTEAGFERARLLNPDTQMDGLVDAVKPA